MISIHRLGSLCPIINQGRIRLSVVRRSVGSLVIGEMENDKLTKSTQSAIDVAKRYGEVSVWLCDDFLDEQKCRELAQNYPIQHVYLSKINDISAKLPENRCVALKELHRTHDFDIICGCSSTANKSLLARFSAVINVPMLSNVTKWINKTTFQRNVYAGNAVETVQMDSKPLVMTIRSTMISNNDMFIPLTPSISVINISVNDRFSKLQKESTIQSDRPELTTANRVVVIGRGVGNKENMKSIYDLADKLDAAVGGTRAAVDMNMLESNLQVGQTGKVVSPALYIGLGVSGSIQHKAGMKESQTIVCINKDPEAPLFGIADFGIVGDMHDTARELIAKI